MTKKMFYSYERIHRMEKLVLLLGSLNKTHPKGTMSTASKRTGMVSEHCQILRLKQLRLQQIKFRIKTKCLNLKAFKNLGRDMIMPTSGNNYKLWTKQNKHKKLSESSGEFNTSQEKLKQN